MPLRAGRQLQRGIHTERKRMYEKEEEGGGGVGGDRGKKKERGRKRNTASCVPACRSPLCDVPCRLLSQMRDTHSSSHARKQASSRRYVFPSFCVTRRESRTRAQGHGTRLLKCLSLARTRAESRFNKFLFLEPSLHHRRETRLAGRRLIARRKLHRF